MIDTIGIDLFLGLDLGKEFHHAHGRTKDGRTAHDKRLPNTEPKLRELFDKLVTKFGTVPVVVDQVANIGALPLPVARASGLPGGLPPGTVHAAGRRPDRAPGSPGRAAGDAGGAFAGRLSVDASRPGSA